MNKRMILRILGIILMLEAVFLLLPVLVAVIYRERAGWYYLYTALGCAALGLVLWRGCRTSLQTIYAREGLVTVALCWIVLSVFGALPYFLSGSCGFVDAIFETVSGLTTTGASIFSSPSSLPRGLQFWRALTQWMGGMGILVLMLALLPKLSEGSVNLMKAESPGHQHEAPPPHG